MDDSYNMKALAALLIVLALVAGRHDDGNTVVNLEEGVCRYDIVHECHEGSNDLSQYNLIKNDENDLYKVELFEKKGSNCYILFTCDFSCRHQFYNSNSDNDSTEVEFRISDGDRLRETITVSVRWSGDDQNDADDEHKEDNDGLYDDCL